MISTTAITVTTTATATVNAVMPAQGNFLMNVDTFLTVVAVMLTAVTVILTVIGLVFAGVAVWGVKNIRKFALGAAQQEARRVARETARETAKKTTSKFLKEYNLEDIIKEHSSQPQDKETLPAKEEKENA